MSKDQRGAYKCAEQPSASHVNTCGSVLVYDSVEHSTAQMNHIIFIHSLRDLYVYKWEVLQISLPILEVHIQDERENLFQMSKSTVIFNCKSLNCLKKHLLKNIAIRISKEFMENAYLKRYAFKMFCIKINLVSCFHKWKLNIKILLVLCIKLLINCKKGPPAR